MKFDDIFREQIARYDFAKKIAKGNILDISYGSYISFYGAQKLFTEGATEIWSLDVSGDEQLLIKRTIQNQSICTEQIDLTQENMPESYFDLILSHNVIQLEKNPQEIIKKYHKLLTKNGILLITTPNKNTNLHLADVLLDSEDAGKFSSKNFFDLLNNSFSNIKLYSQLLLKTSALSKQNFRNYFKFFIRLSNIFRHSFLIFRVEIFSRLGLFNLYKKLFKDSIARKNEPNFDQNLYVPIPFNESDLPLFLIAICSKNDLKG